MQISRHWRLNPVRYRLEGYRYPDGSLSLQNRPLSPLEIANREEENLNEPIEVDMSQILRERRGEMLEIMPTGGGKERM